MNEIQWRFSEPLENKNVLDEIEIDYAFRLPDDFKTLIQAHNAGIPDKGVFDFPKEGMVIAGLLSFNTKGDETVFAVIKHFEKHGKLSMLPFASDGFGNLICLKDDQVMLWSHETEETALIADSFPAFLDMLHM